MDIEFPSVWPVESVATCYKQVGSLRFPPEVMLILSSDGVTGSVTDMEVGWGCQL